MSVDEELGTLQGFEEYTPAEWARADVLVEIAGRLAERLRRVRRGPAPRHGVPELRKATVEDAEAVVAMHERCSYREPHPAVPRADAEADRPYRAASVRAGRWGVDRRGRR